MSFIWPAALLLLMVVPLFIVMYMRLFRRRQQAAARFSQFNLSSAADQPQLNMRRYLPVAFFMLALVVLILAMARPETVVNLPRIEGTVILAFDVSGSMAADDLKPTRMDAAKTAARSFIERQPPNVRIGVVAFSDSGFAVQSPTTERDSVLAAINRMAPQRGTSLANGILASLKTIASDHEPPPSYYTNLTPTPTPEPTPVPKGTHISSVIVLLTDGENNSMPDPLDAVQAAVDQGVRIYTVGIGSAAGANLKVEGFTVHTQLDEATLQQIAALTDANYYNAESEQQLVEIYNNLNPQLVIKPQRTEVTAILAGVGILILLIGGMLSLVWFGRLP
ncbi:MAG: VWA domain-containing protein [Anaerolineae bacterium]|nr:VWA domain-containing protein [Anaerolineae bacterium]